MKIPSAAISTITCVLLGARLSTGEVEIYKPSPALTVEEEALFAELSDPSSYSERLIHQQPLEDVIQSTQDQLSKLGEIEHTISSRVKERNAIQSMMERLENQTKSFVEAVETYNSKQVMALVERLQASLDDELRRREKLSQMISDGSLEIPEEDYAMDYYDGDDDDDIDDADEDDNDDDEVKYTMEDIEAQLNFDNMAKKHAKKLQLKLMDLLMEEWKDHTLMDYSDQCNELLQDKEDELADVERDVIASAKERASARAKAKAKAMEKKKRSNSSITCANLQQAVNAVNTAMWKLGQEAAGGEGDDILRQASIVYGSDWTSDTYQLGIHKGGSGSELTLGDARIRQYIPEDWERLLPSGWQDWDISVLEQLVTTPSPQTILPSYVWHSMPPDLVQFLESPFQKAIPAPAEAILNPNVHLGSCWRMTGRSGRVTLRFKRPVVLKNVIVSHYPWIPSAHNPREYMRHVTSAPRHMQIIGYPPCQKNEYASLAEEEKYEYCVTNLGFDGDAPVKYGSFEYKIDLSGLVDDDDEMMMMMEEGGIPTSSVQTFSISPSPEAQTGGGGSDDDDEGEEDGDGDEGEEEVFEMGGCSAIKPTCDGAPTEDVAVQAITLVVDENWGHSDYTCIYRVQVEGEDA